MHLKNLFSVLARGLAVAAVVFSWPVPPSRPLWKGSNSRSMSP